MLHVILILVVIGVLLYAINRWIPMDGKIKTILNWAVVIAVIFWLLALFGVFSLADVPVPRIRG